MMMDIQRLREIVIVNGNKVRQSAIGVHFTLYYITLSRIN